MRPFRAPFCLHAQRDVDSVIERASQSDASGVLLDLFQPANAIDGWDARRIRETRERLRAAGLRPVVHGDFRIPVAAVDPTRRRAAIEAVVRELGLAGELGAPLVVHPTPDDVERTDAQLAASRIALADACDELCAQADRLGSLVWLENLPSRPASHRHAAPGCTRAELTELVARVPGLRLAYDLGHGHIGGEDVVASVRALARSIAAVFVNDNDGCEDRHWLPGTGTIDLAAVARVLGELDYDGCLVVEERAGQPYERLRASVGACMNIEPVERIPRPCTSNSVISMRP